MSDPLKRANGWRREPGWARRRSATCGDDPQDAPVAVVGQQIWVAIRALPHVPDPLAQVAEVALFLYHAAVRPARGPGPPGRRRAARRAARPRPPSGAARPVP